MQKRKFYYGYVITLLSALCYFGSNGILSVSAGNVINELINNKGWDPSVVGLSYTIRAVMGLTLPLVGYVVTKYGPRVVIGFTTAITALCLIFTAYVQTPFQFILAYGMGVSFSMLFNDQLAIFAAVNNWWTVKRGQQSGIVNAAGGLGGVVFPVIVAYLLRDYGWQTSMWALAIMLLIITGIPQWIFYRNHPEDVGQEMDDGYVTPELVGKTDKAAMKKVYQSPVDWEAKDAIRTPQLWMIIISWALFVFTYITVMYFGISKMVMDGMDTIKASQVIAATNAAIMLSSLFLGRFVDKLGSKFTLLIVAIGSAIGCYVFTLSATSIVFVVLFVLFFGIAQGLLVPAIMSMIPSYYGTKNYATIQGSVMWVLALSGGFAASAIGFIMKVTGGLNGAFVVAALVSALGGIIVLLLKPPKLTPKYQAMLAEKADAPAAVEE